MNDSIEGLRHKIEGAAELESVVRTMKALAASSIEQYEKAVISLNEYYATVTLGISLCLKHQKNRTQESKIISSAANAHIVVFGSDQGLVGQFNDILVEYTINKLSEIREKKRVWAVGERVYSRLEEEGIALESLYNVPNSVNTIATLITQILLDIETAAHGEEFAFYIFHNSPSGGSMYQPVSMRLLPLDIGWEDMFRKIIWPTAKLPEIIGDPIQCLEALIHEYLFVSLFKACAESLASENASRMTAMQRAEKNIKELQEGLTKSFHQLRQNTIDEELFDVISGFEALRKK